MKKTITIILLSVAVLGAAGWMVWQQQTIKAAKEKHQQESKTNDEQLSKLKSVQADMKHENEKQKKKMSTITKKLKNKKKAYQKEVKQRKILEAKIDQLQKELTAAKATAQAINRAHRLQGNQLLKKTQMSLTIRPHNGYRINMIGV
ncbi:hypothetical protein [Bacillus safensis]|uniref:hypothetical protein n=1 Tax=Bacillus safensis TaxID=561879 RepID=UPI000F152A34|nr:hypothetical protein [Bacillus safensis]MED4592343.1 hypothetical protein [Bacillus safensis]MED4636632.1 hypothetical protein [Bacillus safensis]VCT98301.1 hypothetical protein AIDNDMCJ_14380 [Bacillus safensis]